MKVLHVVNAYPTTEAPNFGIFIKRQIDSIKRAGVSCDVHVIHGKRKSEYLRAVTDVAHHAVSAGCDLIHAHYSFSAFPVILNKQRPLVVSYMGSDIYGNYSSRLRLFSAMGNMLLSNLVALRAEACICKSMDMAGRIIRRSSVIPNGIDFVFFRPLDRARCRLEHGWDADEKVVCFAADPANRVKNFSLAESAVRKLRETTGWDVTLKTVYGQDAGKYLSMLNSADVVILTSHTEGSPNVVKEALACNVPVVSVDVGDARSHIKKCGNCFIARRDESDLAEKLERILSSGKRADAREHVAYLDQDMIAERIIKVYKTVLGQS